MIEIKKCTDPAIYSQFGITADESTVVMIAKDKDLIFGAASARVADNCAVLLKIETRDEYKIFEMDFGLGKSMLNLLDLSGVRFVFSSIDDKRLMTALKFKENAEIPEDAKEFTDGKYFLCLDGYFTAHDC